MADQHPPSADHENRNDRQDILPPASSLIIMLILFAGVGIISLLSIVMGGSDTHGHESGGRRAFAPEDFPEIAWTEPPLQQLGAIDADFRVPAPPFSEDIYPCSACHEDLEVDRERRELEMMHEDIVLDHGPEDRWCFDCHNADDRDRLRLANGTLIGFDESYRLCGQCHGTIFRDWRQGIHGRRRGFWNGPKSYLLCAHCHNPHRPRFAALAPMPPPVRPEYLAHQSSDHKGAEE